MKQRLETLPGVVVFEGHVDDKQVTFPNSDRVAPYVVIWPTPAYEGEEQGLAYCEPHDTREATITVAAGNIESVLNIAQAASTMFHRVIIPGEGEWVRTEPFLPVQWDETVKPGRHYLPMSFKLYK